MFSFFAFLFGLGYVGTQLARENAQISRSEQLVDSWSAARKRGEPMGLLKGMIKQYTADDTGHGIHKKPWDGKTFGYYDYGTDQWFDLHEASHEQYSARRHDEMKKISPYGKYL